MEISQSGTGDRVRVRRRTWVIQDVDAYEHCRVLTLAAVEADGPRAQRVIEPFDDVLPALNGARVVRTGVRRWRHACRALLRDSGPAWALRTAVHAKIDLLPFQLEPALAILRGLASRLLLADDVGLGKTVQATLILAELLARGVVSRALVVCPAGLREQWSEECASRFHLPLTIVDQHALRTARGHVPVGVNPWSTIPFAVSSIDFVKRPEILPSVVDAHWDLVVVDEAHGSCGQSERRDAVSTLSARAPYVLLLSATPHNGDESAFATLCGMGRHGDDLLVFRRSRLEVGRDAGRRMHTLRVALTTPERHMHAALSALTRAVQRESTQMDRSVWLLLSLLHKRALSSPFALAASAERRLQLLGEPIDCSVEQLRLPWEDAGELDSADTAPMWSTPALADTRRERRLLEALVEAARRAEGAEGKLRRLQRLLDRVREPVIVFTEYRDTLQHVRRQIAPHAAVVHGGLTREERRAALDRFPSAGVLLATDAAGEGLNLQQQCRFVINLELPWNPMRLEQRAGRVDRIGQRRRVHVCCLVSSGTGEARLLDRLSARVSHARARVAAPDPLSARPAWTEDASARLIVLKEESTSSPDDGWAAPSVPLTRLHSEGKAEAERLALVRGIGTTATKGDTVPSTASTLVVRSRVPHTRSALPGSSLALVRTSLVDGTGRIISTAVHGVVVNAAASALLHDDTVRQIENQIANQSASYLSESAAVHATMTRRRLERARAILQWLDRGRGERQPGLFDRRAETEWQDAADAQAAALMAAAERVGRAERALDIRRERPAIVLVLTTAADPHS